MGFNSAFEGLMQLEFSRQIFEKSSNVKFYKNMSSGSQNGLCGRTDRRTEEETGMQKVTVAFRNFANNAPEKLALCFIICFQQH
jgi:hypothetical protein